MSCSASGARLRAVPLLAELGDEARRNLHRREHAPGLRRIPRQDFGGAVDIGIREPGFGRVHQPRGHQRALLARVHAHRLAVFQKQERGQRAARLDAPGRHQLRRLEDVDRREIAVFGLALVDVGQGGIGGAEVDADFHGNQGDLPSYTCTFSLTLNSSFQRRPSRATHQSCSMPVSVTTVSNDTGTTSADASPASKAHFHGRKLFQLVAEIFDQVAGLVVLAHGGGEEAELGRLADHQAEFAAGNALLRAFLHAERHHRQRLERSRESRERTAWRFRCRHNTCAARRRGCARRGRAAPGRNTPRRAPPRASGLRRSAAVTAGMPSSASQESSVARMRSRTRRGIQHAAVEKHVRGAGQAAGAAPHRALLASPAACWRRKRARCRVMAGIGRVGQAQFLQAHAPLRRRHLACWPPRAGSLRPAPARYRRAAASP